MTSEELMNEIHKKESEIICLTADLTAAVSQIGDWKVAKYQEYILAGLEAPYDIAELHSKRQAARDRINELRAEIEALQAASAE
jgi:sensor histidine kinase regulating citrate/malate metabolism